MFLLCMWFTWCHGISVNDRIPYDEQKHNQFGIYLFIVISSCGLITNSISLHVFYCVKNPNLIPQFPYILALNIIGFIFTLYQLIKISVNLHTLSYMGGLMEVQIDAILNSSLALASLNILIAIAYSTERHLTTGKILSSIQSIKLILFSLFYALFVATLAVYLPYGGSQLQASGIWAFIDVNKLFCLILQIILVMIIPQVFLMHQMYSILRTINNAQNKLQSTNTHFNLIGIKAKGKYVKMIMKLNILCGFTSLSLFPVFGSGIYQLITKQYPPAIVDIIAGGIAFSNICLINPILIILLNYKMKEIFLINYYFPIKLLLYNIYEILLLFINNCIYKSNNYEKVFIINENERNINIIKGKLNNYNFWLNNEILLLLFIDYCKLNLNYENILFINDSNKFQLLSNKLTILFNNFENSNDLNDTLIITEEMNELWFLMNQSMLEIYELYIEIPNSPLEINISTKTRNNILKILNSNNNLQNSFNINEIKSLNLVSIDYIRNYCNILNETIEVILNIIETDIFPRFKKSIYYINGIDLYIISQKKVNNEANLSGKIQQERV